MKRLLSSTLSFLLAFVLAYAGSGINEYSFCCDDCHTFGIDAVADNKCCDVHNNDCSTSEQDTRENNFCDASHQECELDRLDLDLQDITKENSQSKIKAPILKPLFTATLHNLILNSENEPLIGFVTQTQKPPNLSESVYFSLLETLII